MYKPLNRSTLDQRSVNPYNLIKQNKNLAIDIRNATINHIKNLANDIIEDYFRNEMIDFDSAIYIAKGDYRIILEVEYANGEEYIEVFEDTPSHIQEEYI